MRLKPRRMLRPVGWPRIPWRRIPWPRIPWPRAPWLAALAALTALRLLVAGSSSLSPDEAYYWTWSRALAPGYLDHPPMTALWIRAGTWLLGDTALGVRLLSPLAAGCGTLLLAAACADLLDAAPVRRGECPLVAAALLNATLLLGAGAVTITPDTPLLLFWTAALCALGRVIATRDGRWWLAAGLAIGLALDSKYTVLLPGGGLTLWLVATREGRRWLRTPWPWLGGLIALLLFSPVLRWNAAHGWASFLKQGGRTGAWHPADAARNLAELLGGQVGLATPLIFALFVSGMVRIARHPWSGPPGCSLLAFVTVPAALVFIEHALGDRVQANWPGLLYPACAIAAASLHWRWRGAAACGLLLTALVYVQSTAAPLPLPRKLDITLVRLAGWQGLARQVAALARADRPAAGFIVADEYGLASELAYSLPGGVVLAAAPRWRLFALPHPDVGGGDGLLLQSLRRRDAPDKQLFSHAVFVGELRRGRGGRIAESYRVYRVTVRAGLPEALRAQFVRLPSAHR